MLNKEQIKRVMTYLRAQKRPNIATVTKEFNILRTTLSKRFYGHSVLYKEVTANTHLKLSLT
jgi:hypothetical protein